MSLSVQRKSGAFMPNWGFVSLSSIYFFAFSPSFSQAGARIGIIAQSVSVAGTKEPIEK